MPAISSVHDREHQTHNLLVSFCVLLRATKVSHRIFEFEFELITRQAAIADLSRGTAQVYNYKRSSIMIS